MAKKHIRAKMTGVKLLAKRLRQMAKPENKQVFHRAITNVWRDAGEAFIRAAMRQILVQTGMSAASFLPLARFIKRQDAVDAIKARLAERGKPRNRVPQLPTGQRTGGTQGPAAGRRKGEKAFTFSVGTTRRFRFRFSFVTTVYQHAKHEEAQQTLSAGILAFRAVVDARLTPTLQSLIAQWASGRKLKSNLRDEETGDRLSIETEIV